jgi:magnesium transporter
MSSNGERHGGSEMTTESGIVNCSVYRTGRKLADLTVDAISDVLKEEGTFVWVGLREPDQALMRKIQEEFGLHELAVEDAQKAHQRPKLEDYGETLFVVLHTAMLIDDDIQFGETHVFVGRRFVINVRHGPSVGYAKVRERTESMPDRLASGPGYVLYSIIDFVVDHYQPCIDNLQDRFRTFEQALFDKKSQSDNLQDFYDLKNELLTLQAAAVPLIDICTQLLRFHSDIIPKENRIYYRDILDHVARVTQTADRMREMINAAMQVALAQVTIRQNEVVKRLAGWGAILAVPTMIFSWYGMNFEFMPELKWKGSYPFVMGFIVVACILLHRRLRRVGWL